MRIQLVVASAAAILLVALIAFLISDGFGFHAVEPDRSGGATSVVDGAGSGRRAALSPHLAAERGSVRSGTRRGEDRDAPAAGPPPTASLPRGRENALDDGGPDSGAGTTGSSERGPSGDAVNADDVTDEDGRREQEKGDGLLRGAALTTALEQAIQQGIDEEDLGELQGLLISELTMRGTHFSPEDLPLLFDALLAVDDYGMQKLVLTHLDRLEGSPEELVGGYLDYLEGAPRPYHSEEAFQKLVKLGGEEAFQGISGLFREAENPTLHRQALEALAEMKDPRSVSVIQEVLREAQDPQQVSPYLRALARIGGREGVGSLVDYAIRDANPSALRALREVTDVASAPVIARGLSAHAPLEYQREALRTLGKLANPSTVADLSRFLEGAQGRMVYETMLALARFSDPQAARALEDYAARQADARQAQVASRYAQRVYANIERARDATQSRKSTPSSSRSPAARPRRPSS